VLVVTRDREMIRKLDTEQSECLSLRFARNGYEASALVESFQPAFVIVDAELPGRECDELVTCLSHDARVPGLKVFLAAPYGFEGTPPGNGVTGVLMKPFGADGIRAAVDSVEVEVYPAAYDGTASPQE
jgi:AmiR/NasT family two-component response regulator